LSSRSYLSLFILDFKKYFSSVDLKNRYKCARTTASEKQICHDRAVCLNLAASRFLLISVICSVYQGGAQGR
jgi:hypothetical protein